MRLLDEAPAANLVFLGTVDSTNDLAERIMAGFVEDDDPTLPETVLLAGSQRCGHGRGSNTWASPEGGLYATWLVWLPLEALATLPMAVGLACARAVEALLPGVAVGLKWPNDLYVGGRKLGGALCHARSATGQAWVRVGVGINVAVTPCLEPADPVRPVALSDLGWSGDVRAAVWALVSSFLADAHAALDDPEATRAEWVARSIHRPGDALRLRLDNAEVEGRFVGFAPEGSLELEVAGETRRFASGELVLPLAKGGA